MKYCKWQLVEANCYSTGCTHIYYIAEEEVTTICPYCGKKIKMQRAYSTCV